MSSNIWWTIIIILLIVIGVLSWLLFAMPAVAPTTMDGATTTPATTTPQETDNGTTPPPAITDKPAVETPSEGATVQKTFTVAGEAPGPWFFEASFPVQVRAADGHVIGQAPAQAQGDWMTTEMVPFSVTITVEDYSGPATLVLLKDNPSGLPENADSLTMPIIVQ